MGTSSMSRRSLFKLGGVAAVGALGASALAGCAPKQASQQEQKVASSWRDAPAPIEKVAETVEYDLVVVGAGNGGLVAAMTAQEKASRLRFSRRRTLSPQLAKPSGRSGRATAPDTR